MSVPGAEREYPFPLPNGWFQVAYGDEVASGEVRALHYFGRDFVLFRDERGVARVLDAHCPHLGANLIHGGEVENGAIRCPFHHWKFDGDGRCIEVPYADRIPARARIHSWPVHERHGIVFMYYDRERRPPAFDLPDVPEYGNAEWTDYYRQEFTVRSRNQELAENSVDPVHFKYVHGTAEVPRAKGWPDGAVFRANMDYPIAGASEMQYGTIDIHAHGLGVGVTRFRGIVDTTVVIGGTPIDDERVHQRLSFMVKKRESDEATEGLAQMFVAEISRQFAEDMPIWENKVYWDRPALCEEDGPIAALRRWGQQFY